jgi:hypothetical protein
MTLATQDGEFPDQWELVNGQTRRQHAERVSILRAMAQTAQLGLRHSHVAII